MRNVYTWLCAIATFAVVEYFAPAIPNFIFWSQMSAVHWFGTHARQPYGGWAETGMWGLSQWSVLIFELQIIWGFIISHVGRMRHRLW